MAKRLSLDAVPAETAGAIRLLTTGRSGGDKGAHDGSHQRWIGQRQKACSDSGAGGDERPFSGELDHSVWQARSRRRSSALRGYAATECWQLHLGSEDQAAKGADDPRHQRQHGAGFGGRHHLAKQLVDGEGSGDDEDARRRRGCSERGDGEDDAPDDQRRRPESSTPSTNPNPMAARAAVIGRSCMRSVRNSRAVSSCSAAKMRACSSCSAA